MSRPQLPKRLVAAAVLFCLCSALFITTNTRARAAGNTLPIVASTKISPDLQKLIQSGNGDTRVKVIVQSTSSTSNLLGGLLNTVGGLLVNVLANLNIRIVDVEANSVEVLASDPSVSYISLDAPVRSSGHITNTCLLYTSDAADE